MSDLEKLGAARVNNDNVAKSRVRKNLKKNPTYVARDEDTKKRMEDEAIRTEMERRCGKNLC
jgi:hypothetical protein